MLYLGLAQWSNPKWQQSLYGKGTPTHERLRRYAQTFTTVEGSTTFYATPTLNVATQWAESVDSSFRFTFKLPQTITHQAKLKHCEGELTDFFRAMTPLMEKTGMWNVQLPAAFGPEHLQTLERFLQQLPERLPVGVEVRHPAFFAKGDEERQLNALLIANNANRVIMDSRPIFSVPPTTAALIDAQSKKPKVPVHAIATGCSPMIRYIGLDAQAPKSAQQTNSAFFSAWVPKLAEWQQHDCYLMIHTSDNTDAPTLAIALYEQLQTAITSLPSMTLNVDSAIHHQAPQQINLID